MNFRQVETFRAVMLTGSMTAAADKLHTSQPNVSRAIARLEQEVGFELFDRVAGRVLPTRGGEALFREIERAFIGLESVADSARAIRELGAGTLRIAAAASISQSVLPRALRIFSEKYPAVRLLVSTSESPTIANMVASGQCDVGFVSYFADKPGVVASVIHVQHAVCILPAGHRLARRKLVTPRDLRGERFISLPAGSSSRMAVDAAFAPGERIMALETTYASTIYGMVREGLGVSLVNPLVGHTMNTAGVATRPFRPNVPFTSHLLLPQLAPRDTHATHFVACMRSAFKALSPAAR
jgi:DNA-binding transcriptional LysR family regulator